MSNEEWSKYGKVSMFRDILEFKKERGINGYSIMEVIMMYCDELDKDIDEVGALLKKDKNFVATLQEDLKFNNEAKFEDDKKSTISEWI